MEIPIAQLFSNRPLLYETSLNKTITLFAAVRNPSVLFAPAIYSLKFLPLLLEGHGTSLSSSIALNNIHYFFHIHSVHSAQPRPSCFSLSGNSIFQWETKVFLKNKTCPLPKLLLQPAALLGVVPQKEKGDGPGSVESLIPSL